MRNVLLYSDEDGNWVAEVPSLPGCNTGGKTRDEALANIREAIELWIEDALEHGEIVPDDVEIVQLEV
jgi:predicted RNase H-like HicB family nuclease